MVLFRYLFLPQITTLIYVHCSEVKCFFLKHNGHGIWRYTSCLINQQHHLWYMPLATIRKNTHIRQTSPNEAQPIKRNKREQIKYSRKTSWFYFTLNMHQYMFCRHFTTGSNFLGFLFARLEEVASQIYVKESRGGPVPILGVIFCYHYWKVRMKWPISLN